MPWRPPPVLARRAALVAGYGAVCLAVVWAVAALGLPYSTVVLLAAPPLVASAWFEQRVYLAMLPMAGAAALVAILLRAPDLPEALVALAGLGVTVLAASETVFRLGRSHRATQDQLRRRADLLDALHATAVGLLQGGHAEDLLDNLLRRACQLLGTPHGNLFLVEGGRLRCRLALGATRWMQEEGLEVAPGQGLSGVVWETGRPVVVGDYQSWPQRMRDPRLGFVRHAAAMPLKVHGRVIGVVVVVRAEADRPFSPEEVEVVERFADLASLVVQNAHLYRAAREELQRRRQAEQDLVRQHHLLRTLHATTEELLSGTDFDSLVAAVVRRACALLRATHGNLYLREGEVMRCAVGVGAAEWAVRQNVCLRPGEGMVGRAWVSGQPLVVEDYASWPGRLPFPEVDALGPAVTVPLRAGQEVVGAFFIARNRGSSPFTQDELELARRFGHLVSLVLHQASLHRATREELEWRKRAQAELVRRQKLLEALQATSVALLEGARLQGTLDSVVRRASDLLGCPHAALYLREGDLLRCVVGVGTLAQAAAQGRTCEKGKGIVGTVWERGAPVVVEDYATWPGRQRRSGSMLDGLGPGLAVPLWRGAEFAGTLFLARDSGAAQFTGDEVDVAQRFAQAAALVLHHAGLYREVQEELERRRDAEGRLRRRQELLQALYSTTEALLAGLPDPDALLQTLVDQACALLSSPHGILYVVEGDALHCRAAAGAIAWAAERKLVIGKGQGLTGRVWETQQTAVVEDYATWPGRLPHPGFDPLGPAVCVPLRFGEQFVGAFSVARDRGAPPFTADEIETAVRFGQLASLVLRNAQLVQQAHDAARRLDEQRAFYEDILNQLESEIAVFDPQLRYVYVNPAAIQDPELRRWIIGRDDYAYCLRKGRDPSLAARRQESLRRAIQEGRVVEHEETIVTSSGEERVYLRRACPVLDDEGRVVRVVGYGLDITDRKRAELRLAHLALHDALTGLPNRTLFMDRLTHALDRAKRTGRRVAVLFVDLDRFKAVNDTLGHEAGDALLQQVAERLRSCLRSSDTLARLAGDEFTVLLEDVTDLQEAEQVAQRLQLALREPFTVAGQPVHTTASVGIALSGPDTQRAEELLRRSDAAMYRAKALGRNRSQVFGRSSKTSPV